MSFPRIVAVLILLLVTARLGFAAVDPVARAAEVVAGLEAGDFARASASFDASVKAALPADALGQVWGQLGAQVGALKSKGPVRTLAASGATVVLQRLVFERAELDVRVAVSDATGEVSGLFFTPPSDEGSPVGAPPPPQAPPAVAAAPPLEVAGQLLRALEARDFAAAAGLLGGPLASMLPADKLAGIWGDLVERMGTLDARAEPAASALGGGNVLVTQRLGFARGPLDMKTTVESATGRVVGLFFSPASSAAKPPPPDAPFTESPVRIGEGQGALDGLLTLPRGTGPFPCVVLVHGSGPHDRDETIGPNRPFRDMAWGLAERGIASVRYDKRTLAHAGAMASVLSSLTLEHETVRDAAAAVATARGLGATDPDRVVVAGHSLGGTALPRIAERARGVAGLVFLAASAEPLEDAIVRQSEYIAGLDGGVDEGERLALDAARAQANLVKSADLSPSTPSGLLPLGVPAAYWLDLRQHDPAKEAAALPVPMLFVQGGRDYQVTLADLDRFRRALRGRRDVRFAVFPALNHLFMPGEGPSRPEEYLVEGRVDAGVLDAIASFVKGLPGG